MMGEIGVIFNIPQPFTVRTKRLSQVVRISHHHFKQMVQPQSLDGKKILSNFIQVESHSLAFHIVHYYVKKALSKFRNHRPIFSYKIMAIKA